MKPNTFFKQLQQEMKGNSYQERFLEELEEHAQDLAEDHLPSKKSLTFTDMKKHFGEPKEIKKTFINVTQPFHRLFAGMEALMYGFLMIPLFYFWLYTFLMTSSLFDEPFSVSAPFFYLMIFVLSGLISFLVYSFLFRRWHLLGSVTDFSKRAWVSIAFVPMLILFVVTYLNSDFPAGPIFPLLAIAANFIIAFLADRYVSKNFKKHPLKIKSPKKARPLSKILWVVLIYMALFSVSHLFLSDTFSWPLYWMMTIFQPLYFVEFILFFGLSILINGGIYFVWVLGLALFFIALQSFLSMCYHRRFSLPRGVLILYALSLLFIRASSFEPTFDFTVPAYPVSADLEKSQMSLFYGLTKYMNNDEGKLFHYEVKTEGALFALWQNTGTRFYFEPEHWIEKQSEAITQKESTDINYSGSFPSSWPTELTCVGNPTGGNSTYCEQILFKGQPLLANRSFSYDVQDLALSDDENWLLMVLATGFYDPDVVYLLDLSSLHDS